MSDKTFTRGQRPESVEWQEARECFKIDFGRYSPKATGHMGPILVAQLTTQSSGTVDAANKPERCQGKRAFEAWLERELTLRQSKLAGGSK
jgi:hypothetical protein